MAERGLIYGRASRDPKHRGTSVDDQIRECQVWADANGVDVVRVVRDDNRSATRPEKHQRLGFVEVLETIAIGEVDILIVWEASRAARDLNDFLPLRTVCRDAGVKISYKGRRYDFSDPTDKFTASLDAVLAEREASEIRDRNMRTVRRNAELRRPHGRLPYGYRRVYDTATGALQDQTPFVLADAAGEPLRAADGSLTPVLPGSGSAMAYSPEATVLREAAEAFLAGRSLRRITLDLNARGVPSPRRPNTRTLEDNPHGVVAAWHPQSLRQRLLNPTIAGRRVHRREDIGEATWAPIIEYGRWLTLRAALTDASRLAGVPRGPEPRHLLSGIARCGECGARLKARTNLSRLPLAYSCEHEECRKVTVSGTRVDEMVDAAMTTLLESEGYRAFIAETYRKREDARQSGPDVSELIAAKEAERDELEQLRAGGGMTMRAYAAEDMRLERELEELRSRQIAPVASPALRRMLATETLAQGWRDAGLSDRREVIRILLDVKIHRATKRGRKFDYWRVEVNPGDLLLDSWGREAQHFDLSEMDDYRESDSADDLE